MYGRDFTVSKMSNDNARITEFRIQTLQKCPSSKMKPYLSAYFADRQKSRFYKPSMSYVSYFDC